MSAEKPARENADMRLARMLAFDAPYCAAHAAVAAMDEVGRGPLAGPVVVACLLLPPGSQLLGVNDSKKVSEKKRESLCALLLEEALAVGYGVASPEEIDQINILQATHLAAQRAISGLDAPADFLLCDELKGFQLPLSGRMLVDGDAQSYRIAAASIVAKVYRDAMMKEAEATYPQYGFAQHKGYGTAAHIAALREHGPCPLHRRSFLKRILPSDEREQPLSQSHGRTGEDMAAVYLRQQGYIILARNHRSPRGEIDIVARQGDTLVFVEVKMRSHDAAGLGRDYVDERKQRHLVFAAQHYLSRFAWDGPCRFDVVEIQGRIDQPRISHIQQAFEAE